MKAKLKVIPYGDKLMILQNDAISDYISIHSVKDCKKELAKQENSEQNSNISSLAAMLKENEKDHLNFLFLLMRISLFYFFYLL